jgi:hypothetical protein
MGDAAAIGAISLMQKKNSGLRPFGDWSTGACQTDVSQLIDSFDSIFFFDL